MASLFKVGDNAVYPSHGVGVIKKIEERKMGGQTARFYVLQILGNQMTVMVPTESTEAVGLRQIIPENEVEQVYEILKDRSVKIDNTTWNRRYREYSEKIRTGSVFEIAEVLRNLFMLRHDKDLSFGERKMLDTAKGLLVKELSIAQDSSEDDIEKEIEMIFEELQQ